MSLAQLREAREDLGLYGRIVCLDIDGNEIPYTFDRGEEPIEFISDEDKQRSYTSLRTYLTNAVDGRILIGGKLSDFSGVIPGLMEEALMALRAAQPVYLAGGFGGATHVTAVALQIDDGVWYPPLPAATPEDGRLTRGRNELREFRSSSQWSGLRNGLNEDENKRLAASHRPTDIAALVAIGLGRTFRA
jgi:hypothetical protein